MKLNVLVVRQETDKAVQVIVAECLPFLWLPKSQLDGEIHAGDRNFTLNIPDWLWEQKIKQS